jgi:TonB family protein
MPRIFVRPALATLFLHGLLIYLLTVSWVSTERDISKAKPISNIVNARLVDVSELKPKPKPQPPAPKVATKKPVVKKPEPKKPEPKKPEPKKPEPKKPEPKKPETRKPAPKKPEPLPQPKVDPRITRDELARIARDELSTVATQQDQAAATATADEMASSFVALIRQTVVNYWSRPPSARNGMEAELVIQLIPTGEVVSVTVIRSSGNSAFDRSAVNAVQKAGAFPELQKLPTAEFEKRFRRFNLLFKPEDLRY